MRLALAQINADRRRPRRQRAADRRRASAQARDAGARLVLFPECAVSGYPAEDLLLKDHFLRDCRARARPDRRRTPTASSPSSASPSARTTSSTAPRCSPTARSQAIYRKMHLPNYGVFDEVRYFQAGEQPALIEVDGVRVGLTVCEDIWQPGPPASDEALAGATADREHLRLAVRARQAAPARADDRAARARLPVRRWRSARSSAARTSWSSTATRSCATTRATILARSPGFTEDLLICDVDPSAARRGAAARHAPPRRRARARGPRCRRSRRLLVLGARAGARRRRSSREPRSRRSSTTTPRSTPRSCTGLRDYVEKNGFDHVVLGLSGGIDSTLVVAARRRRARRRPRERA